MKEISRLFLMIIGMISVFLGILGVFLPLLPTTPFLLLAAICFARSSKTFYAWLINNKLFGNYLKNYQEEKAISAKHKTILITLLWLTIVCSILFFINFSWLKILLVIIALAVSVHIATRKPLKQRVKYEL